MRSMNIVVAGLILRKQIQTMLADFYLLKAHTLITVGQTNKFTLFLSTASVRAQKHIDLHQSPVFLLVRI